MFLIHELAHTSLWFHFSPNYAKKSRKLNRYEKSQSQNRLEWGTLSSRNQPEMALERTLPDLTFSQLQWDLGTRLRLNDIVSHKFRKELHFEQSFSSLSNLIRG